MQNTQQPTDEDSKNQKPVDSTPKVTPKPVVATNLPKPNFNRNNIPKFNQNTRPANVAFTRRNSPSQ